MLAQSTVVLSHPFAPRRASPNLVESLFGSPALTGPVVAFETNAEIYGEGETADSIYKVVSGAVRTYRLLSDGRRQIVAFHLPGDVFGLDFDDQRRHCADSIGNSTVMSVKKSSVFQEATDDPRVARQMWEHTARE